jgi:diguanylate cyclase (GGDEF)-like protein/PAS domain S-box-containing protein
MRDRVTSTLGSLKLRITLGGIASLAFGIGLVTLLVMNRAERDMLADQRERELSESVRAAEILSRRVVGLQRSLQAAAHQLEAIGIADDMALVKFIESKQVLRSLFGSLFVVSPAGRMLVLVDEAGVKRPDVDLSNREYFQRTLAEGRLIVSEPVDSRVSGAWVIVFTAPVRNAEGIFAVLGASMRLTSRDLLADLTEVMEADTTSLVVITNATGRILAPSNQVEAERFLSDEPRLSEAFNAWTASGSPVEPGGLYLPQSGQLVTAAGVAGPDWMVWRARHEAELLLPLRAARHEALVWASGLIVLLSVVLLCVLLWLLRPLTLLERRAGRLLDGQLSAEAGWPVATGEIGQLAQVLRHGAIEQARLEALNSQLLRKLGSVMSAAPVGIAFIRNDGFELVSEEFCRLFRVGAEDFLGKPTHLVFASPQDCLLLNQQQVRASMELERSYSGEWLMQRSDASHFWGQLRSNPVDTKDPTAGAIWTLNDISDQRQAQQLLEWAATHDALTGLANRKLFEQRVARVFEALPQSLPAAIVFIDLDRFKPINDTAGHAAGDAVLTAVAAAMTSTVRMGDLAARLGGDEFALLLERCSPEVALRIANEVCAEIAAIALPWEGHTLVVGSSLGVSDLTVEMQNVAAWISAADAACYGAKAAGRGTVRVALNGLRQA